MSQGGFYAGVEVINTGPGASIAVQRGAATCFLIGTAPVDAVHADLTERAKYIEKPILIRSREDAAAAFGPHTDGFTIPAALDAIFDQAKTNGVGTIEVVNVFDPGRHANVAAVTNLDIIGDFNAAGEPSGLKHVLASFHRFGRFCKQIIAPGFNGMTGVRAELETLCNRTRARTILDAPAGVTMQQAVEARGPTGAFDWQTNSRRTVLAWPHVRIADLVNGGTRLDPLSSRLAGVWLSTIMENGYHHSPSNRPVLGIEDSETPVLYIPGDKQSDVQLLRGAGIVTLEESYGKGPHISGNRSAAWPTDTDMRNFLHAQFTIDMVEEAVIAFLELHKDRPVNAAKIEFLEDGVNALLKALMVGQDPALSGGEFRFDRTKTTITSVAAGQYFWRLDLAPIGIGERITVDSNIDLNLLGNPLGLAA